ncbi:MAG TPA: hypothetical protein VFN87_20635 [Solirubrobacteraceae bacterium]|nr:hypothetical protein [Solirubrobacteraceae bacterium]
MPHPSDALAEAERLFESGRIDEARERLESLLASAGGDSLLEGHVLSDLAVVATYAGNWGEAADLASRSLERCPSHLPALEVIAYCEHAGAPRLVTRPKRLLYILNHRTLIDAEVPILQGLGYEVFVAKITPDDDPAFRSQAVTYDFDETVSCSAATLAVLNRHDFYRGQWSETVKMIVNQEFDVVALTLSSYLTPLAEAVAYFRGQIVARAFGREHPFSYTDLFDGPMLPLLTAIDRIGDRFVFGQGYANLAEIETGPLRARAHTVTIPLPQRIFSGEGTWTGTGTAAIFICPGVRDHPYYGERYAEIKRDFADLPHAIFGRQVIPVDDASVLPYLTDVELEQLYVRAPVFVYPSREARHVHYSPIEAMVIGTPVLYRRGALIDTLADGADTPGVCRDTAEMRAKARALLDGDRQLAAAIRSSQQPIVDKLSVELAARQWTEVLCPAEVRLPVS